MGFGVVNVIDPQSGAQFSIIAQFQTIMAMLLFFSLNIHQWFLKAIVLSFEQVPLFQFNLSKPLLPLVISMSSKIFIIGVKVGAPMIAILVFSSVALGLIARTVPQMNVFIVGFPLKIAIGLFALSFSMPIFSFVMKKVFGGMRENIFMILKTSSLF
jgi:flagellar biosynthetic protein FliR